MGYWSDRLLDLGDERPRIREAARTGTAQSVYRGDPDAHRLGVRECSMAPSTSSKARMASSRSSAPCSFQRTRAAPSGKDSATMWKYGLPVASMRAETPEPGDPTEH